MIDFDFLEKNKESLRIKYLAAQPFPHLIIDNFCEEEKLSKAYNSIPELEKDINLIGAKLRTMEAKGNG